MRDDARGDHARMARLELEFHAAVRQHARLGPAEHAVLGLERRKHWVSCALEEQLCICQTERCQMQLCAGL